MKSPHGSQMRWSFRLCVLLLLVTACRDQAEVTPERALSAEPSSPASSVASTASARATAAPSAAPAAKPRSTAQPFMWVAKSGDKTSHLLGTVHLGQDAALLPQVVFDALDAADTFVMEADPSKADPQAMFARAMLPEGKQLDEMLGPEPWAALVKQVGTTMSPVMLKRFKPWFVMILITQSMVPKTPPMDSELRKRAEKAGHKLAYLEELSYQLELFEGVVDLAMLKDGIRDLGKQTSLINQIQDAYTLGDAATAEKALFDPEEMKKHPKMFEVFFYKRNADWVPKLEKHLAAGNAFIAVGAGHLLGDKSVLSMLKDKGIRIERVPAP